MGSCHSLSTCFELSRSSSSGDRSSCTVSFLVYSICCSPPVLLRILLPTVVGSFTLFTVGCGCVVNLVLCLHKHPLWLVLFHTVDVSILSLGVDVVCHCFCSPCCDIRAAAWVTVLCTVFVGVVFWCPYSFCMCCPP